MTTITLNAYRQVDTIEDTALHHVYSLEIQTGHLGEWTEELAHRGRESGDLTEAEAAVLQVTAELFRTAERTLSDLYGTVNLRTWADRRDAGKEKSE